MRAYSGAGLGQSRYSLISFFISVLSESSLIVSLPRPARVKTLTLSLAPGRSGLSRCPPRLCGSPG